MYMYVNHPMSNGHGIIFQVTSVFRAVVSMDTRPAQPVGLAWRVQSKDVWPYYQLDISCCDARPHRNGGGSADNDSLCVQ